MMIIVMEIITADMITVAGIIEIIRMVIIIMEGDTDNIFQLV